MDKKYIELFKNLARSSATTTELVIDYYNKEKGGEGVEGASTMHEAFQSLYNNINSDEANYHMTKADAAQLAICSIITLGQLQNQLDQIKKAITGYQTDIMPKLQEIVEKAKDDIEAAEMAEDKFVIQEK